MTNGDRWSAYWQKSRENLDVSDHAQSNGKFNAAASRYYYALIFAARALIVKRNKYDKKRIIHTEFIEYISGEFGKDYPEMKEIFSEARELRVKGDYSDLPVREPEIEGLLKKAGVLLNEVEGEINAS
jgi:uncharacterized protein (UPF0332 family)